MSGIHASHVLLSVQATIKSTCGHQLDASQSMSLMIVRILPELRVIFHSYARTKFADIRVVSQTSRSHSNIWQTRCFIEISNGFSRSANLFQREHIHVAPLHVLCIGGTWNPISACLAFLPSFLFIALIPLLSGSSLDVLQISVSCQGLDDWDDGHPSIGWRLNSTQCLGTRLSSISWSVLYWILYRFWSVLYWILKSGLQFTLTSLLVLIFNLFYQLVWEYWQHEGLFREAGAGQSLRLPY